MALPVNANIVSITESTRFTLGGQFVRSVVYKYTIGTDGPFTLEFDAGTDTPEAVSAAIAARAASIAALRGNS